MAVNRIVTLQTVFEHWTIFTRLMDRVPESDKSGGVLFELSEYELLLLETSEGMEHAAQASLFDTLSIQNLEYNSLLEVFDPSEGRFSLNAHLEGLLRQIEAKRIRELSDKDLIILLSQIDGTLTMVKSYVGQWSLVDQDYQEILSAVKDTFYHVSSSLRTNVRSLEGHTDRLSTLLEDADFAQRDHYIRYRETLQEVSRMYHRNVLPTLEFLNPLININREQANGPMLTVHRDFQFSPMRVMQEIVDHFGSRGAHGDSLQLNRLLLEIKAMGRDITTVAERLKRYIKMDEDDRKFYDKAEERYNRLLEAVQKHQHGKQTDLLLKPNNPVFNESAALGRLRTFHINHGQCINWPSSRGRATYDELMRTKLEITLQSNKREPATNIPNKHAVDTRKTERLQSVLSEFNVETPIQDAHAGLHEFLYSRIDDYSLAWLGEAIEWLAYNGLVKEDFYCDGRRRHSLTYREYQLTYRKLTFEPKSQNTQNVGAK